jgi:hypothetical protein
VVVVEPGVLPASVVTVVGVEPTTAAELDEESSASADNAGW